MKTISELCNEAHQTALEKGWWDKYISLPWLLSGCCPDKACRFALDTRSTPYTLACHDCGSRMSPDVSMTLLFDLATDRNQGELIALIHSELSEALEAMRKGERLDEHCPDFLNVEIEFADALIRIFDMCQKLGYRLGAALEAKMEYNKTREYRHGKKF